MKLLRNAAALGEVGLALSPWALARGPCWVDAIDAAWLASIFALRMLGLFLILPVFAVHARGLPGGENVQLVGLAMGAYGLTQAFLQIPFGWASDRHGRKRVIVLGLLIFAAGSLVAAAATTLAGVVVGRAIQGAGAISAAITAPSGARLSF